MKEFSAATYLREPLISSSGSGGQCVSPPPNRLQHILESNRYSLECEKKPSSVQHSTSFLNLEDMNEDDFKSEDYEAEENANEEDSQKDRQSLEFIKVLKWLFRSLQRREAKSSSCLERDVRSLQLSNSINSATGHNTELDDFDHDRRSCSPMNDSLQHTPSLRHSFSIDNTTTCEGHPNISIHTYDYSQDQLTPTASLNPMRRSESCSISSSHVLVGRGAVSSTNQSNPVLTMHRQFSNSELTAESHHLKKIQSNRWLRESSLIP